MDRLRFDRRQRISAIALMCAAVACFACLDTIAKYLSGQMPTLQVVWARYTGAFLLAFAFSNPLTRPGLGQTTRPVLQLARSALLLSQTALNFLALRYLQLDLTLSIVFATPLFVAILAGPLLGEWFGWRRWTAILVGFAGVVVVTRPGHGGLHPAALYSLASAVCYAFYAISTRVLARTDSSETTLFYSNVVGALATLPALLWVWTPPSGLGVMGLMLLMGALGSIGHYLLIAGHRLAPASVLSPFIYTQLVWVAVLGYAVFGDVPNRWTIAGAAIVVGSGLYVIHRERRGEPF